MKGKSFRTLDQNIEIYFTDDSNVFTVNNTTSVFDSNKYKFELYGTESGSNRYLISILKDGLTVKQYYYIVVSDFMRDQNGSLTYVSFTNPLKVGGRNYTDSPSNCRILGFALLFNDDVTCSFYFLGQRQDTRYVLGTKKILLSPNLVYDYDSINDRFTLGINAVVNQPIIIYRCP